MYTQINYKTKKQLKEAIAANGHGGGIFQPGPFGGNEPQNGTVYLEGPHFPATHTWYAKATVENGKIIKVS